MKCADRKVEQLNCDKNNNNKELIMDLLRGITSNFVNFACGDYTESTNRCESLGPQPTAAKPVTKTYYTPIFLLVDLMESMDSFQTS